MRRLLVSVWLLLALLHAGFASAEEKLLPRTVIAVYDPAQTKLELTSAHRLAEMPLNHLGINLEYHDVNKLPDLSKRDDVRGILGWFPPGTRIKDPKGYLAWASAAMDAGKRYVIMENPGFYQDSTGKGTPSNLVNAFLRKLELNRVDRWIDSTADVTYSYHTPSLFVARDTIYWTRPPFEKMTASADATVHLTVSKESSNISDAALVVTSARGGYVAEAHAYRATAMNDEEIEQWLIDPFAFFRLAFATDDLPKPDTTTMAGRRIYYSHIDGDGWNSYVQLEEYRKKPVIAARAVLEKAIRPYKNLPVTVTPIAADLNSDWAGMPESVNVAKEIFMEPQVEPGTHTYSHPFDWDFFTDGNVEKERPFLRRYHLGAWDRPGVKPKGLSGLVGHRHASAPVQTTEQLENNYFTPRAYATEKFDIKKEIGGSITEIGSLLPEGKKIELVTWSGNCAPFEEAIRLTREAQVQNVNGGDSRFDADYPSYASVPPIGRPVGSERQIYASNSNENTYTNLWTGRYFGFQFLRATLENTESPIRVKPFNIYYHLYSAEKTASLNALIKNLDYAEEESLTPLAASHFSRIGQSFYTTQLYQTGSTSWRVKNRGALQTIRFDRSSLKKVDFGRSTGVIGQRHFQGSLYVYLDETVKEPVIALADIQDASDEPATSNPYLIESRWLVSKLQHLDDGFRFEAHGFGTAEMAWRVPGNGKSRWSVQIANGKPHIVESEDGFLHVSTEDTALTPQTVTVRRAGS
jgi:polysaccharide biosynthesis protein PelA